MEPGSSGGRLLGGSRPGPYDRQNARGESSELGNIRAKPGLKQRWNDLEVDAVIFGCTDMTFAECLDSRLFGLPAGHFSYVKLVKPGMPLFLFNYSKRKLFGVFEAVSFGDYDIDEFAWTRRDHQSRTSFPAQARVKLKEDFEKIISLDEDDFKPLIEENYFSDRKFYFDLNARQTHNLMRKFSAANFLKSVLNNLATSSSTGAPGPSKPRYVIE